MSITAADIQICKTLQRQHGKSYFFATMLMPKKLRQATFVLYAFFRIPDDFVDNPVVDSSPRHRLTAWLEAWREAYTSGFSANPVLRATAAIHQSYQIPIGPSEIFLHSMQQDLTQTRYASYADLRKYMDGSAAAVGEIMAYTIGFKDPRTLNYARDLGYAMQLTNFLRDIDEDYQTRARIYLPQDLLNKYGVSENDFKNQKFTLGLKTVIQELAATARELYRSADQGIPLLNPSGQRPVRVASRLYEAILDKLAEQGWNPFIGRAHTSTFEKVKILINFL